MAPPPLGYMVREGAILGTGTGVDSEKFTGMVKGGLDSLMVREDLYNTLIKSFKKGGVTVTAVKTQEDVASTFASILEYVQGAGKENKPKREEVMRRLLEGRPWSLAEFQALTNKARCVMFG